MTFLFQSTLKEHEPPIPASTHRTVVVTRGPEIITVPSVIELPDLALFQKSVVLLTLTLRKICVNRVNLCLKNKKTLISQIYTDL